MKQKAFYFGKVGQYTLHLQTRIDTQLIHTHAQITYMIVIHVGQVIRYTSYILYPMQLSATDKDGMVYN